MCLDVPHNGLPFVLVSDSEDFCSKFKEEDNYDDFIANNTIAIENDNTCCV